MSSRNRADANDQTPGLNHPALFVSVKTLAESWDCSRTTVSRILDGAGMRAYYFGGGPNGAKRYLRSDVDRFLQSLPQSEPIIQLGRSPRMTTRVRRRMSGEQAKSIPSRLAEGDDQCLPNGTSRD